MELELFGDAEPLEHAPDPGERVRVSAGPPAVSSQAPALRPESAQPSRDLSFLRGLTLPDIPVRWDDRVIRYLEFFRDDPRGRRHIRAWMERLNRYGPTIRHTLEQQGLPRDLIFVAMVESGFDPTARSHARAAGMWQFMEPTGESLGLTVDHWVDLRLDPARATDAAGRYLGQLHQRFGTWELAFAAYNMGYGALLRSIRKYNTNDYWALAHLEAALPFETTLYVSKILACAIVAHNLTRFGLADLDREEPIRWETVSVPGGVTLAQIARAAGTDQATLRTLNPGLRRGRTPPTAERFDVHIPPEARERFAERWARSRPRDPISRTHVLRFGETLADLARATGASEDALRELNGVAADERVGAGTTLLVPAAVERRQEASDPAVVAVPDGPREIPGRRRVFYRVVRGDELGEIARFFRVDVEDLRRWNAIDAGAALQSGMFLQLFVQPEVDLAQALVLTPDECRVLVIGSDEFFAYHEGQNGRVRFRYRVQPGDTLSEIAQRFGVATASMARINQISRDATLYPGAELVVYAERSRVPAELLPPASIDGDALEPGGEATVESTGPAIGTDEAPPAGDDPAPE
jgi:membrane-bound lytic murein transglycosylase D